MFLLSGALVWLLTAAQCVQVRSETYKMKYNPNMFDDQYIGCSHEMVKYIMPKVLHEEMANEQFRDAWINATEKWYGINEHLELPEGFEDEYGIALVTLTNNYPKGDPIYRQLNGNLTIAGASRKDYMEKFHFKALHFYLTRALQILKPNCNQNYTTYRGSKHSFQVQPVFKFGTFTPSTMQVEVAKVFGTESLFEITTCFGARIFGSSFFPSFEEVLIPPTEKFVYVTKANSMYILRSTGEMCSYFNCAYRGAEKRKDPVCRSDATQSMEETQEGRQRDMMSASELEERIGVLELLISQNHLYWDHYQSELERALKLFADDKNETSFVYSLKRVSAQITDLKDETVTLNKDLSINEGKIVEVLTIHATAFRTLNKKIQQQEDTILGLTLGLVTFGVTGASILVYKYWMRNP